MNGNIERLLPLLLTLTQLLTFLAKVVRFISNQFHQSDLTHVPQKLSRFALRHWAATSAVLALGWTIVFGYLSEKPLSLAVIVMLALLIVVPHIHGTHIWRRNSEKIAKELTLHLAKTLVGYMAMIVLTCFAVLLLNPSIENIMSMFTLPHHLVKLASPLVLWAALAGIVSPLVWENARQSVEEFYLKSRVKRLR